MFEARVYFKSGSSARVKMRHEKPRVVVMKLKANGDHDVSYYSYLTDEVEDGLPVYRPRDDE